MAYHVLATSTNAFMTAPKTFGTLAEAEAWGRQYCKDNGTSGFLGIYKGAACVAFYTYQDNEFIKKH